MKEEEPLAVVRFRNKDASFYWRRLVYSIQLKNAIDQGAYGQLNWWRGTSQTNEDKTVTELTLVNLHPRDSQGVEIKNRNGIPQPGLRNAVLHTVWGSYRWLCANGYEEEVKTLIDHDRNPNPPYEALGQ